MKEWGNRMIILKTKNRIILVLVPIVSTLHIMAKQPRKQPRTMVWPADSTVDFPKRC